MTVTRIPARIPVRRDLRFDLPAERIGDWHGRGAHVSHFFNALSIFFPLGERFFIDSVRNYRERIDDPELRQAVTAFIGQEAMHGREHVEYNRLLADAGLPAEALEAWVGLVLKTLQTVAPAAVQLSVTLALEHFTAILADALLRRPELLQGSEPRFRRLWRWHAAEETEHKAVAFDVWDRALGRGIGAYAIRGVGMLGTAAGFCTLVGAFTLRLAQADPRTRRRPRGYLALVDFLFSNPGLVRRGSREWLRYFAPSFHPWQHDNRDLLEALEAIVASADARPHAAAA